MADSRFKEDTPPAPDFELFVGDKGGEIINGDVPIRWCITQEYIQKLEDEGVIDPHVLIASYASTSNDKDSNFYLEMDRKLIPLTELMTYLRFSRAGKAKIYAIIVDGSSGRAELHNAYLRRRQGEYDAIISTWTDELHDDLPFFVKSLSEFVEIPAGVFGKEPSPWMKWYVNFGHNSSNKVVDECHYRRRWLIAFGVKWMAVIPFTICLIIMRLGVSVFLSLAGYPKKVNVLKSFRPFKYPDIKWNIITDSIDPIKDNMFIRMRKTIAGSRFILDEIPMLTGLAFTPIVLLFISLVVVALEPNGIVGFFAMLALGTIPLLALFLCVDAMIFIVEFLVKYDIGNGFIYFIEQIARSKYLKYAVIILIGVLIILLWKFLLSLIGVMLIGITFLAALSGLIFIFNSQIMQWMLNKIGITAEENDYTKIKELLCPKEEDNLRPNIKYIPKSRRTIRLWYLDTKNKMCKPMQQ